MTTDNNHDQTNESADARNRWVDEAQEALDRTVAAVRSAWDATRESRMSALESAKQAAQELGRVLDKGVAAARDRWATEEAHSAPPQEATGPAEQSEASSDVESPDQT
jgi:ABC-type nitrate/sulfonate/bicarbonate transport system substrate-binding protein